MQLRIVVWSDVTVNRVGVGLQPVPAPVQRGGAPGAVGQPAGGVRVRARGPRAGAAGPAAARALGTLAPLPPPPRQARAGTRVSSTLRTLIIL